MKVKYLTHRDEKFDRPNVIEQPYVAVLKEGNNLTLMGCASEIDYHQGRIAEAAIDVIWYKVETEDEKSS